MPFFARTLQSNDDVNMRATTISSLARQIEAAITQLPRNGSYIDGEITNGYLFNATKLPDLGKNASSATPPTLETARKKPVANNTDIKTTQLINKYFPGLLSRLKRDFLPKYKNPCFQEGTRLLCLPYFYLGGAPKCGTTDMWFNMLRHPSIFAGLNKEPHFWKSIKKTSNGAGRYLGHFNPFVKKVSSSSTSGSLRKKLIVVDGSASTLWANRDIIDKADVQTKEVPFVFADVIHEILPKAKFIFILRDLTNRTISDFFAFSKKKSPSYFHDQVVAEISKFNKCLRSRSLRTCVYLYSNSGRDHVRLHIGVYVAHIREWLRVFPAEQILILRTEQWHNHTGTTLLQDIFKFLDVG